MSSDSIDIWNQRYIELKLRISLTWCMMLHFASRWAAKSKEIIKIAVMSVQMIETAVESA